MESLRLAPGLSKPAFLPCSRCGNDDRDWDRIGGRAFCTECQESLILGRAAPLRLPSSARRCAACSALGTVPFLTFPLRSRTPLEMHLCGPHLRCLLVRDLPSPAFNRLRRRLAALRIDVQNVFLLHDVFYDERGRALQPASEPDC
jgi:hypothetical protein